HRKQPGYDIHTISGTSGTKSSARQCTGQHCVALQPANKPAAHSTSNEYDLASQPCHSRRSETAMSRAAHTAADGPTSRHATQVTRISARLFAKNDGNRRASVLSPSASAVIRSNHRNSGGA